MKSKNKILVVTPTYNESENIIAFIGAVLKSEPVDMLIVDDNSPDKTAVKIKNQKSKVKNWQERVFLLERKEKLGLGSAYRDGFRWALENKYRWVISMDADFSHDPKYLNDLISVPEKYAIAIGSRYVKGGAVKGWGVYRYLNSYVANWLTRFMLNIKSKDATAGFKKYRSDFVWFLLTKKLVAPGYAFQVETLYYAKEGGFRVFETPIVFVDRRAGESKIAGEAWLSIKVLGKLFSRRRGVRQFTKFAIVGTFNTLVDWAFFYLFKIPFGFMGQAGKQMAKGGSFVVSSSSSYVLNRRWTFRSQDSRVARQMTKFFVVALIGLIFNNLIFYLATAANFFHLTDIAGLVIATAMVMFWNFSASKYWTFK